MKAEIIIIGDEILIGQIADTNSGWMAQQLNLSGIEVVRITSVHDLHEDILAAFSEAELRSDLIMVTGGLGPTKDDITRKVLCEHFNTELVFHQATFDHISERFKGRGIAVNKLNRDQALVPASCIVIPNSKGTAPGMWFNRKGKVFVSMPGVPFEMKSMMIDEIIPRITSSGKTKAIVHKTILTQGIPESILAERLEKWESELPSSIKLAWLPNPMSLRLRLSAYGNDEALLNADIEFQINKLLPLVQDCFFGFNDDTFPLLIGRLLTAKNAFLSVAESCTGGNISHMITLTPGSSKWYAGGITAYSNAVKTSLLGVAQDTLDQFGAVSQQIAVEMALGVKRILKTDYSVATTGIAGPDGGSEDKPVGTVWISVAGPAKFICKKFVFGNDREINVIRSSQTALHLLHQFISENQ